MYSELLTPIFRDHKYHTNRCVWNMHKVFFTVLKIFYREAFRDSVAQAGTLPALSAIRDWIHKDIIRGNEAAEILSVLPRSALTPTPEYIELLFVSTDKYVK